MDDRKRVKLLIDILFDPTAREDERDDAAMYLGHYPYDEAEKALLSIGQDPNDDDMVRASCGTSLAEIWTTRNHFDPVGYSKLTEIAMHEAKGYIASTRPEWVEEYNL